jgi:hypothetical protein
MSFKDVVFYLVCAATWFIIMPTLLIGGTIALLSYAVFWEVRESILGRRAQALDNAAAREMARRMCLGN